jgi:integrase
MRPYRGANGLVLDDENMTLGDYLDSWLSGSVQQSTYDGYEIAVKVHIKPLSAG